MISFGGGLNYNKSKNSVKGLKEPMVFTNTDPETGAKKKAQSYLFLSPMQFLSYHGDGLVYNKYEQKEKYTGFTRYYFPSNEVDDKGISIAEGLGGMGSRDKIQGTINDLAAEKGWNKVLSNEKAIGQQKTQQIIGLPWDGSNDYANSNKLKVSEIIYRDSFSNQGSASRYLHPNLVRLDSNGIPFSSQVLSAYMRTNGIQSEDDAITQINETCYMTFKTLANLFLNTMNSLPSGNLDPQYIYVSELLSRVQSVYEEFTKYGAWGQIVFTYGLVYVVQAEKGANKAQTDKYDLSRDTYLLTPDKLYSSENPLETYVNQAGVLASAKENNRTTYIRTQLSDLDLLRYLLPNPIFTSNKIEVGAHTVWFPNTKYHTFAEIVEHAFAAQLASPKLPTLQAPTPLTPVVPKQPSLTQPNVQVMPQTHIYAQQAQYAPPQAPTPAYVPSAPVQQQQYSNAPSVSIADMNAVLNSPPPTNYQQPNPVANPVTNLGLPF